MTIAYEFAIMVMVGSISFGIQNREDIMAEEKVRSEEFHVNGDEILKKIKELVHEGNIRRVIIKNEEGRTLIDIPLTLGVVGALVAPQLAAIGAIAALITRGTIVVEKVGG
jgi:hypothetical protein